MNKILTIAIPTYNRINDLQKCISCILKNIDSNEVELLVSDNCSTDGTKKYMESIIQDNDFINYYRNDENLGADQNFLNCINKASSKYIWLIGDDDFVLNQSINNIIDILKNNPDFLFINPKNDVNPKKEVEIVTDINLFMQKMNINITFMTSLIFNSKYLKKIDKKEKYIGTSFLQSHLALLTLKDGNKYYIKNTPTIKPSPNLKIGYDLYSVWFKNYHDLLYITAREAGINSDISDEVFISSMKNQIIRFVFQFRITCRKADKTWNKHLALDLLKHNYGHLYRYFYVPIKFPAFLLRIIRRIYIKMKWM